MRSLCPLVTAVLSVFQCIASANALDQITDQSIGQFAGVCVQLGIRDRLTERLAANPRLVVHCLDAKEAKVSRLVSWSDNEDSRATIIAERWAKPRLPYADNLVNVLIINDVGLIDHAEAMRAVCPGGTVFFREGGSYRTVVKPWPQDVDEWSHQWHAADGGLVTADARVGVPRGLQWISGPLFAMAGRKSSTQSLVSAGGRNFYVTQNVLKNVGRPDKIQYLVARDAFNGLTLWQREWTGPFVTGNGETNPRMVASSDVLYVVGGHDLLALDAVTGAEVARFKSEHEADKLGLVGSTVLAQSPHGIIALDRQLDSVRWQFRDSVTSGMVISEERVLLLVSGRSTDGNFRHDLICLDLASGERLWGFNTQDYTTASRVRISFAADGYVALQSHGMLHLHATQDGSHLWTRSTDARPGKTYVDERYVGHFYRHGLVWMLAKNSPREPDGQNVWLGLSPSTGELKRELKTVGAWPRTATPAKMGCQLLIASDRFVMIPRQATFIDFQTGKKHSFKFTRGGCGQGFVPANGLVYSHPHACGCFSEAVRGFMGMHSSHASPLQHDDSARLEEGPSYGRAGSTSSSGSDGWKMYRRDRRRSAATPAKLSSRLDRRWSTRLVALMDTPSAREWQLRSGNRVSAPTMNGQMAYVADIDQGRVFAVSLDDGQVRWKYAAAGRIDSPPTLYQGLCLFGSHDGYVYCLNEDDGSLVWRFRAAPQDRRIVAYGALEATWPVVGTVMIDKDRALVAAGRAPDADGGIEVHALEPRSGKSVWSTRISHNQFEGVCDYLVGGSDGVFLSNWKLDVATGENGPAARSEFYLRGGKVGLLESSWTRHDLALRKDMQTWTVGGASGQLLAFTATDAVSYDAQSRQLSYDGRTDWSLELEDAAQVTAIALTGSHVVVGCAKDRQAPMAGGVLWLLDRQTGRMTFSAELPTEPVLDGIAVAHGHVLITTQDGQLHCFGPMGR